MVSELHGDEQEQAVFDVRGEEMMWDGDDFNVVLDHPNRYKLDDDLFTSTVFRSAKWTVLPRETPLLEILVKAGLFKSRNEARKNWRRSWVLGEGMNSFEHLGKCHKNLFIFKLSEDLPSQEDFEAICGAEE